MVQVELSIFEAMQVQTALLERMARLSRTKPHPRHTLEASFVEAGLQGSTSALGKITDALYPNEATELPGWAPGELMESWGK